MASDKVLLDTSGNRQLFGGTNDGKIHLGDTGDGCNCTPTSCPDESLCCTPIIGTIGTNTVSMANASLDGWSGSNGTGAFGSFECLMAINCPGNHGGAFEWDLGMSVGNVGSTLTKYNWMAAATGCPPGPSGWTYLGSTNPSGQPDPGISAMAC